jgi:pimeloyl-ACP methyl ester carboxylesterase/DNA-binding SARP family transcriptional activator
MDCIPMPEIRIRTLGELAIEVDGEPRKLPASKRSRALLAYLLLTGRPHRRERLCELFWEIPDDPRGALRWSLSKLRPLINDDQAERLQADRERVSLDREGLTIDLDSILEVLESADAKLSSLKAVSKALEDTLLDGIDLPDQSLFQDWLTAERERIRRLQGRALHRLATHPQQPPDRLLPIVEAWSELEPFNTEAASLLVTRLDQFGRTSDAARLKSEFVERFRRAGIAWSPEALPTAPKADKVEASSARLSADDLQIRQRVRFCSASDGVRIAYATVGSGPAIVKAANWLSHLELDWDAPIWSPLLRDLAQDHHVIRYDERGNGLSDWDVEDIDLDSFVTDLETVVDTAAPERFALLGISQGAAVSIEYAARHPERVACLILFGGYPTGWRIEASAQEIAEREAIMTLTSTGWGRDNPAYRQIFSSTFMPSATHEELDWFNEFQRQTTSPENAVRFLSAFGDIDVRDRLAELRVPTLVIHSLGDRRIPVSTGRELAASIPDAEFVGLNSDNHLLLGREPASETFLQAVRAFLGQHEAQETSER